MAQIDRLQANTEAIDQYPCAAANLLAIGGALLAVRIRKKRRNEGTDVFTPEQGEKYGQTL